MSIEDGWPDAVLFDLDGTLIDREPLMLEAVTRLVDRLALSMSTAQVGGTVGRAWPDLHAALVSEHGLGLAFDPFMDQVLAIADELLAAGFPAPVLAGGRDLMVRLAGHGVPLAIVTGSLRREVPAALALVDVHDLVAASFTPEDYGVGKPDPAGYLLAARYFGADPARCVVVEDSTIGIAAGRAAGMRVIATSAANPPPGSPSHQDLGGADVLVGGLDQVRDEDLRFV